MRPFNWSRALLALVAACWLALAFALAFPLPFFLPFLPAAAVPLVAAVAPVAAVASIQQSE